MSRETQGAGGERPDARTIAATVLERVWQAAAYASPAADAELTRRPDSGRRGGRARVLAGGSGGGGDHRGARRGRSDARVLARRRGSRGVDRAAAGGGPGRGDRGGHVERALHRGARGRGSRAAARRRPRV